MSPLLLSLLCVAPIEAVEAPRPSAEPIEVTVRVTDRGNVLFAPTLRTTDGRMAEVAIAHGSVRVTPTVRSNGLVRVEIRAVQRRPTATGRQDLHVSFTVDVRRRTTIGFDVGAGEISLEHAGEKPEVISLRSSRFGGTPIRK